MWLLIFLSNWVSIEIQAFIRSQKKALGEYIFASALNSFASEFLQSVHAWCNAFDNLIIRYEELSKSIVVFYSKSIDTIRYYLFDSIITCFYF